MNTCSEQKLSVPSHAEEPTFLENGAYNSLTLWKQKTVMSLFKFGLFRSKKLENLGETQEEDLLHSPIKHHLWTFELTPSKQEQN